MREVLYVRQFPRAFIIGQRLAHYCTQKNKNKEQQQDEENIIHSVLLICGNNRSGNIFACACHTTCITQYACHNPQEKSAYPPASWLISVGQKVSVLQNAPV